MQCAPLPVKTTDCAVVTLLRFTTLGENEQPLTCGALIEYEPPEATAKLKRPAESDCDDADDDPASVKVKPESGAVPLVTVPEIVTRPSALRSLSTLPSEPAVLQPATSNAPSMATRPNVPSRLGVIFMTGFSPSLWRTRAPMARPTDGTLREVSRDWRVEIARRS